MAVPKKRWRGCEDPDEDPDEGETFGPKGEVVNTEEDDWEGFEPEVKKGVDEAYVKIQEEDDWFREADGERANEEHLDHLVGSHAFSFELWLAF